PSSIRAPSEDLLPAFSRTNRHVANLPAVLELTGWINGSLQIAALDIRCSRQKAHRISRESPFGLATFMRGCWPIGLKERPRFRSTGRKPNATQEFHGWRNYWSKAAT